MLIGHGGEYDALGRLLDVYLSAYINVLLWRRSNRQQLAKSSATSSARLGFENVERSNREWASDSKVAR